ncbi:MULTISPECIES: hypothetical protein [Burkholderia cepacia complex]|uniref:hypothetical protein n=1 Tax=Burkholderia cepacia complex TaxID=87882 RepID=UPI0009F366D0|nr:hypothetical protein [Burkholderia stabilis]
MKISFGQIYPEVGASFDFTNTVLAELNDGINSLKGSFSHYAKLFSGDDFSVVFIISATKKSDALSVKGPTTLAKKKRVEFVLHIPYKQFESFSDQMDYALNFIGCGIKSTFDKYNSDSSGVVEIINRTKDVIRADPDKYMKWTR